LVRLNQEGKKKKPPISNEPRMKSYIRESTKRKHKVTYDKREVPTYPPLGSMQHKRKEKFLSEGFLQKFSK
jgi:hypothetical protein